MESLVGALTDKYRLLVSLLLPAFLVCVLVPVILLRRSSKLKLLPPGPRGLPLIGHLHLLGRNPHQSLLKLSKTYGPLMYLRFGSVPVVVASTPTMARQILQAHDKTLSFRPQPIVPSLLYNCENVVFSQPGPYWKLMRQILFTDLIGTKRLQSFQPLITEEVHGLLRSILDKDNEEPVRAKLYASTCHIISRMALGKKLTELAPRAQADPSYNLVNLLVEAIFLIGVFNVGDYMPYLAWMDLQGCARKIKVIRQKLFTTLQEVIDGRREMRRHRNDNIAHEEQDFLDVLLNASERRPEVPLEDHHFIAILTDMFGAGIDTSSVSTEWALCELIRNPIKMKKLQAELEHVVGTSRLVQETDIPHLPYLHAVVKESMRLHTVTPILAPHYASQECNVSGYDIPPGTNIYVNVWAIGRDPSVWKDPLEFNPERFLECDIDVRGQHFELLPFGSGRRSCPGMVLGILNVHYMLASIVHAFDWSLTEELNMSEKFGLILTLEKPLPTKATPRLPMHLFE